MNHECDKIRDLIADSITGILTPDLAKELNKHLAGCADCHNYAKALKNEDLLLAQLVAGIDTDMTNRQQRLQETLGRCQSEQTANIKKWRITMRNPFTKLAVAAVIILAVIFGVQFFIGGSTSVLLADVLAKAEQAQAFMYRLKMKTTGNVQPGQLVGDQQIEATVTISTEYGMKMDMNMNMVVNGASQKMRHLMYILPNEKKVYMIMPEQKQYMQMEFSDDLVAKVKKQSNDPRDLLRQIVNSKYTDIGKSVIDGVEVEGFQTTDPACFGGMAEDVKMTLWVDRKTELPVREQMYYKMNEQTQMEGELYDFQWNVQVNASEFEPVIPQDYTTMLPGGYKLPTGSEEGAIEGLRFCERLLGRYPKKIDMMNLMNEIVGIKDSNNPTAVALKLKEEIEGEIDKLPDQEKAKKIMEIMRPAQSLGMFHIMLVQERKEPAYYGDVVGSADADKVLLRWKTGENEYRVIYGNLNAETVSAEKLAELESKIPKQPTIPPKQPIMPPRPPIEMMPPKQPIKTMPPEQ